MSWQKGIFTAVTAGMGGEWLLCDPPQPLRLDLFLGVQCDEAMADLFNNVPSIAAGSYVPTGRRADQIILDVTDYLSGARPTNTVADLGRWEERMRHVREAVASALCASTIHGPFADYLAVECIPQRLSDLTATTVVVDDLEGDIVPVDSVRSQAAYVFSSVRHPWVQHIRPIVSADVTNKVTVRAQYGMISTARQWLSEDFLAAGDWFWPGHCVHALAGAPGMAGQLEAVSVGALMLWTAVAEPTNGPPVTLQSPPWTVLGYRIIRLPASPSAPDTAVCN